MQSVANKIGVQEDILTLASLFCLNVILCHLWKFIVNPFKRKLFSLIGGIVFLFLMLEQWSLYVILSAIVMHQIVNIQKKNYFWISTILAFSFLLVIHIHRFMYDHLSWKMDCSVMQMFLTTKVIYYGKYLNQNKIKLSLFDFMSYALFFPGVLIGPTFDYGKFQTFIELKGQYSKIKFPNIFKFIIQGCGWAILTVLIASKFPHNWFSTSEFYKQSSFLVKMVIISFMGIVYRIKFYTGWAFTQAAINASGINHQKNAQQQIDCGSFRYETQHNPRIKTLYWNTSVSRWIADCFYKPLTIKYPKMKLLPILVSFGCSALWHGVYLSYYLGFLHWGILNQVSRYCYKASYIFQKYEHNIIYKIIVWLLSNLILNYVGMMIVVLGFDKAIDYLSGVYWSGTIVIVGMYIFFVMNPKLISKRKSKETE